MGLAAPSWKRRARHPPSGIRWHGPVFTDAGRAAYEAEEAARKVDYAEAVARGKIKADREYRAFLDLPLGRPLTVSEVEERFAKAARLMDLNPETLEEEYRTKFVLDASDEPAMHLLRVRSFLLGQIGEAGP